MNATMLAPLAATLLSACFFGVDTPDSTSDTRGGPSGDTGSSTDSGPQPYSCARQEGSFATTAYTTGDALLDWLIEAPAVRERHVPVTVEAHWGATSPWELDTFAVEFSAGAPRLFAPGDAVDVGPGPTDRRRFAFELDQAGPSPTTVVARFVTGDQAPCTVTRALARPTEPIAARITTIASGADGVLWTGTLMDGLIGHVGLGPDAATVHYRAVASADPYDATWPGPQSGLVLALARQGARGLWVGTATTGLSWFDPGEDPLATTDDVWIHHLPPDPGDATPADESLRELRETVTALAADGDGDGVYVGTIDGLWYARHDGDPSAVTWTRLADGPVFAVELLADGAVMAGFTTAIAPADLDGSELNGLWDMADAPLLHLDVAGTPGDRGDDVATWLEPGNARAALALLARPGGVLVGTDRGLYAWQPADAEDPMRGLSAVVGADLAVTSLAAAGADDVWVAARDACDAERGTVVRVTVDLATADPISAIVPLDLAGLGIEPHVSLVRTLAGGDLLVSTLVADTAFRDLTPAGCRELVIPNELSVDAYVVPLDGGLPTPL